MGTENKVHEALCDYLNELGLGGPWFLIVKSESLAQAVISQFPNIEIHIARAVGETELIQASVLVLELDAKQEKEIYLEKRSLSNAYPIIVLAGEGELSKKSQADLSTHGYQLPPYQTKNSVIRVIEHAELSHKKYFNVARYWEERYSSGKNSGAGSYGRLARFKARFLNDFVKDNNIKSIVEFGCGDGAQLSLSEYPQYTGLDISPTVIEQCRRVFSEDETKQFEVYDPESFSTDLFRSELSLSLDVVYHLSNDEVYQSYLSHLFSSSSRFVIIYSNNDEGGRPGVNESAGYVRFRDVLSDVERWQPGWVLVSAKPNRFPFSTLNPSNTSFADFFVFARKSDKSGRTFSFSSFDNFYSEKILNTLMVSDENTKKIAGDVVSANRKIDQLVAKVHELDKIKDLEVKLRQVSEQYHEACQEIELLNGELKSSKEQHLDACQEVDSIKGELEVAIEQYRDACQEIESLKKDLTSSKKQYFDACQEVKDLKDKVQSIEVKYRAANAKYRSVCQQLSLLKNSHAYKAGLYVKAASSSLTDAIKLPVRLWRLKRPRKKQPKQRINLQQGLRYIKWKVVVPLATRLGVPYSKVAYLSFPKSVRKVEERIKPQVSSPQSQNGAVQQPEAFTPPSAAAQEISILGWPEQPPNGKPYVIGIMDEFTTGCFEQDVNLIQPRPDNWYALAEKYRPEFIFIESAWKGNYGSWQYRVADYANKPGQEIAHICQYAREKGIPTLFWNKEDPVHHQKFMCSAKLVDHIFTTDANMKDSYQSKTGNTNVHALPFAAQPALHKPAALAGRKPRSCFAGSWYGNRHAERGEAMRWLLEAANQHGLDIFDRNYGTGIFPFPEEYQAGIKGSLPYKELCDEYSRYRVFLNVNSVTDSPTMFSRRVFELMACGTPVVSTYAKGIDNLFESGAVWMVKSQAEADEAIRTLMTDDAEWRRRSLAGIREVFAKHTYAHRLNDIFAKLGIEIRMPTDPAILLLAEARSQAELELLNQMARQQHYRNFRLGIECPQDITSQAGSLSDRVVLLQPGERVRWVKEQQSMHPIAGWLSPHNHYGKHYLRDLANASLYEPEACGWAKSSDQDRFAYGQPAALAGALWKTSEFVVKHLNHYCSAKPEAKAQDVNLFVIDSDQFQAGAAMQVVGN